MSKLLRPLAIRLLGTATLLTLFVLTAAAQGPTFQVLHRFAGPDGEHPAGLSIDVGGGLYGTTYQGGAHNYGTVFRLSRTGTGWVLNTLYDFQGGLDGGLLDSRVIFGRDGALYGTTPGGGDPNCGNGGGCGAVFKLQPPLTPCRTTLCPWRKTVIYTFEDTGHGFDGRTPIGELTSDSAGNLYGVTSNGGQYDQGIVYQLSPSNGGWTETVLHSFTILFGKPDGGVTPAPDGKLYGPVRRVEGDFTGGIYRLVRSGSGWTLEDLYNLQQSEGGVPFTRPVFDAAGNLYGTAASYGPSGGGTVFELSPVNGGWSFALLYSFLGDNGGPVAPLTFDPSGNLYGTTVSDGMRQNGSVFKLSPGVGGWTYTSLFDFDIANASRPHSNVSFDASGNLYGTTFYGSNQIDCAEGCGVVWEITP